MYQRYFGFKERPFRLSPDPAYLFMGASHREAMARLLYAVRSGEGFATVIGEVGTGKTTVCRSLLDRLDADVSSAYIFNPPGDPVDLIRAINKDFDVPADTDNLQDLIEALNRFLIREKAAGRTVVLVIDEAQHLSRRVLEQVRLLSNLETTRHKLLLIILAGQPELQAALESPDLRQLRQRITARSRLGPLTLAETGVYIRHRLSVASTGEAVVFTSSAIRSLFRFSNGVPRLINMACDRALITAYANSRRGIDHSVVRQTLRELKAEASGRPSFSDRPKLLGAGLLATLMLAAVSVGLESEVFRKTEGGAVPASVNRLFYKVPQFQQAIDEEAGTAIQGTSWRMDRDRALTKIAELWGVAAGPPEPYSGDDLAFFRARSRPLGLAVHHIVERPDLVERLNLPVLLALVGPDSPKIEYAVLAAIQDGHYHLRDAVVPGFVHSVSGDTLTKQWSGTAYVFWRDFYALDGAFSGRTGSHTLATLARMMRDLGYANMDPETVSNDTLRRAIVDFQGRQGLPVDGLVGPLTAMALYGTREDLGIPRLRILIDQKPEGES